MPVTRSAVVLLALVGAALLAVFGCGQRAQPKLTFVTFAHGSLRQANSRGNAAILGARGLLPGHSTSGSAVISNTGDAGTFYLSSGNLRERLGSGGGRLSQKLVLTVADVTNHVRPLTLYHGVIGGMTPVLLGVFQRGDVRTYELTVSFPESGSADNAFQGAQLSVQFDWTAVSE